MAWISVGIPGCCHATECEEAMYYDFFYTRVSEGYQGIALAHLTRLRCDGIAHSLNHRKACKPCWMVRPQWQRVATVSSANFGRIRSSRQSLCGLSTPKKRLSTARGRRQHKTLCSLSAHIEDPQVDPQTINP